jgi:hypothetical protein
MSSIHNPQISWQRIHGSIFHPVVSFFIDLATLPQWQMTNHEWKMEHEIPPGFTAFR